MKTSVIYRSANLRLAELDDQSACYNRDSGDTHLLNTFPAEVLRLLLDHPRTSEELAVAMAALCGEAASDEWLANIRRVLDTLESLELVEPQPL